LTETLDAARGRRILHIAPTPFFSDRGCHIRIRGLVRALDTLGASNRLCTYPIGRDDAEIDMVRCLPVPGYRKTVAGPSAFKIIADPLLVLTTTRQIWKFKPDVLHCHLHEGVLVGWLAKYLALRPRLKIGFDVQGGLSSELESYGHLRLSLTRRITRRIEAFVIARADAFFCSSTASMRLFSEEFGVRTELLNLVPDGADVEFEPDQTDKCPPRDHPVAVYTGGLTESKGAGVLQEIIKTAAARNLPVRFRIIGYPTEHMEQFIKTHKLDNCDLIGQVPFEDLHQHMQDAVVSLEPKSGDTSEASGKLLNYMAAALPVVCFDTSNNRSILGDNGFFVNPSTPDSFVSELERVISDPSEARARGVSGRERLLAEFSWKSSAATIAVTYADMLDAGSSS